MDAALARPVGQRSAERRCDHLLRGALGVVARLRAVHDATARELRSPDGALTGAAGALLLVGLAATAADLAAGLGPVRALAGGSLLGHDDLVDQRDVDLDVEDVAGQVHVEAGHRTSSLAAERMSTSPPLGPGTAPLRSTRPLSASTACTETFCVVTDSPPICPAIRSPGKTRPGVEHPPIEPGLRWLRCAPWEAETPAKPWRFMTPAKPLPLLVAVTSTTSPAENSSGLSSWPTVYDAASAVRISTRWRRGVTPARAKCPAVGLLTLRPSISPKPICTA